MRGFYPKTSPDTTGGTSYLAWRRGGAPVSNLQMIGGDAFLDMEICGTSKAGHLSDYRSVLTNPGLRYNAGAGIRVHVPIFILSLDAGFKLDKRPAESPYAVQFNLGNSF